MELRCALNDISYTENGMIGYKTSNSRLVDFNYQVSQLRYMKEEVILNSFKKILSSNERKYALRYLFFVRDINEGLGERRIFRTCLEMALNQLDKTEVAKVIEEVANYGRFDDLFVLLNGKYKLETLDYLGSVLEKDIIDSNNDKKISLLAKWLPSINASNAETRKLGLKIASHFGMTPAYYRKTLSSLRKYIDVVEVKTSSNRWEDINYNNVPSKANLKYMNAFMRHDLERRKNYIQSLSLMNKEAMVNAKTLMPYEILEKILKATNKEQIDFLTSMWTNLGDLDLSNLSNTIVVKDGSGSMYSSLGKVKMVNVASSLALYTAEKLKGPFKDSFITFSMNPKFVDLSECMSFEERIKKTYSEDEVSSTNIEKVFEIILRKAVENNLTQEELPNQVIIISDMEFDSCAENASLNVFESLKEKYKTHGYNLPKLIFWNLASRRNTIPCKINDLGVILMSGFSQNALKLVCTGKDNSLESLIELLESDRYSNIPLVK